MRPDAPNPTFPVWPFLAAAVLSLAAGCATDDRPPPPQAGPAPYGTAMGSPALGAALARTHCSACHSVEREGDSPMKAAPPLRSIGLYPVADLQEAFAEGVVTAHPAMPPFEFDPDEIADLLAYMETLNGLNPRS